MTDRQHVMVTGGAGFLGQHLCRRLLEDGYLVTCVDNLSTNSADGAGLADESDGYRFVNHDVAVPLDFSTLSGIPALIFHLASPASPRDYQRLPVQTLRAGALGTANLLALAADFDARLVLASTSEIYGDPLEHPQRESYWGNVNPIGPRSMYDEAKRFAEALVFAHRRSQSADIGVARIFNTYGPGMRADDGRVVPTFCRQALTGDSMTVYGDGRQTRSLCYVDDTIDALVALAESGCTGPFNIGNPEELSVLQIAEMIRDIAGSRSSIRFVPADGDDPRRRCPDIAAACRHLGWQPQITAKEGLTTTVEWFAQQGM